MDDSISTMYLVRMLKEAPLLLHCIPILIKHPVWVNSLMGKGVVLGLWFVLLTSCMGLGFRMYNREDCRARIEVLNKLFWISSFRVLLYFLDLDFNISSDFLLVRTEPSNWANISLRFLRNHQ